jgi:uncharacterized protein YeaO (DUF488 family)
MVLPKFSQIITEDKLRSGLPHIRDLNHEHFGHLIGKGHIKGDVTEKSDGQAFEVGHDHEGFYTRTSRSDRIRHAGGYKEAAHKRFGDNMDPSISKFHDDIHRSLHSNETLRKHLAKTHTSIKGEMFDKVQGTHVGPHHVNFVGTSYDKRKMGEKGTFVVHTRLPENKHLDHKKIEKLGDHHYNFTHDDVKHHIDVDATDIHQRYHALDKDLLHSRKHADREGKAAEKDKFEKIKHDLHTRIAKHTSKIHPKWGPETEGHVVHPHESNPHAPRIKIVDGNFMARKHANAKFHTEAVLTEGGNVHFGDSKTVPIKIEQRHERAKDVDHFLRHLNKEHNHEIFGKNEHTLNNHSAYSGSSHHMMNSKISDAELGKHKKTFGDVDVMVPHHASKHIEALKTGSKYGKFTVQGIKKIGDQHSVVVKHEDGQHHQVDFEYKEHDKHGEPTQFAKWSQNSDYGDMKHGLKGVHHKELINAVTSAHGRHGIVQVEKKTKTTHTPAEIRSHTFSPQHGLRDKHYPIHDASGHHLHHEGKPVYGEHPPGGYDKDLHSIHHKLFGKKPSTVDIHDMHSFKGVAHLVNKHFEHHHGQNVAKGYVDRIYGRGALDKDPHVDKHMKDHSVHELSKHIKFDPDTHAHWSKAKAAYAAKVNAKHGTHLKEDVKHEKHLHVAMAAGRFTGPTKEHEKLINNVLKQKTDHHYVFVMGPSDHSKTTEKDPLTVHEKISHLKKLYPEHKHVFVPGTTVHTKTPVAALSFIHFRHKDHADHLHLHVVAGKGEEGVEKNAGGSIDNYKNMVHRMNGTKFPERINDHGQKVGGDHRMNYKTTTFVGQERGTISGSKIRKFARDSDPNNKAHVHEFKSMLHSGVTHDHAKEIMHQIKHRKSLVEELGEIYDQVLAES